MPDRDAPSPDALDLAMDVLGEAERYLDRQRRFDVSTMKGTISNWTVGDHYADIALSEERVAAARAAVRRLAEQGEHWWAIALDTPIGSGHMHVRPSDTEWELHAYGCRVTGVRVTRIEEAP